MPVACFGVDERLRRADQVAERAGAARARASSRSHSRVASRADWLHASLLTALSEVPARAADQASRASSAGFSTPSMPASAASSACGIAEVDQGLEPDARGLRPHLALGLRAILEGLGGLLRRVDPATDIARAYSARVATSPGSSSTHYRKFRQRALVAQPSRAVERRPLFGELRFGLVLRAGARRRLRPVPERARTLVGQRWKRRQPERRKDRSRLEPAGSG